MPAVCDCFPELKSVTLAREARYRADPSKRAPEGPQSSLEIKVISVGNLNERVETRNSRQAFRHQRAEARRRHGARSAKVGTGFASDRAPKPFEVAHDLFGEPVPTSPDHAPDAPTPLEYLLSGAVGCYAAVFAFYAAKLGVDV